MSDIKLSQASQKYIEDNKIRQNTEIKQVAKDNGLKQDTFVAKHKKEVVAGGILGTVALAFGMGVLAHRGKLGSKAKEIVDGFLSKITKKFANNNNIEQTKVPQKPEPSASAPKKPIVDSGDSIKTLDTQQPVQKPEKPIADPVNPIKTSDTQQPVQNQKKPIESETKIPNEQAASIKTEPKVEQKIEVESIDEAIAKSDTTEPLLQKEQPKQPEAQKEIQKEVQKEAPIEQEPKYPLGDCDNPFPGGEINIATGDSVQKIQAKYKRDDGKYETFNITLDELDKKEPLECRVSGYLSSDMPENYRMRWFQFGDDIGESLTKQWKREYEKHITDIIEDFGHKPTFDEYCDFRKKEFIRKTLKDQYEAVAQAPVNKKEHYLYRGITLRRNSTYEKYNMYSALLENAKIGDVITPDWNTTCTSYFPDYALSYSGNALMRIKTPVGAQFAAQAVLDEVNLPSMAQLKLTGKQKVGEFTVFDFDYIMPDLSDIDRAVEKTMKDNNVL